MHAVPVLIRLRMWPTSYFFELPVFVGLLLVQASFASHSSIYSKTQSENFTHIANKGSDDPNPTNLSHLIEFLSDNSSVSLAGPIIKTIRLKTHLIVENRRSQNKEDNLPNSDETKHSTESSESDSSTSENPLEGIEYIDEYFTPYQSDIITESSSAEDVAIHALSKRFTYLGDESSENTELSAETYQDERSKTEPISNQNARKEHADKKGIFRSSFAKGRQFVFHPYLPYEKDIPPDEKISFHDILPVKMVKFVKTMVEEAPWEAMFMKMVRMVVDQFVDKIIEKMFAGKDEHHAREDWKPWEVVLTPIWKIRDLRTPIVRLRRAVGRPSSSEEDEDIFVLTPKPLQELETEGKKTRGERKTLLDHVLDWLFPESKEKYDSLDHLKKRDTAYAALKEILTNLTMEHIKRYVLLLSSDSDSRENVALKWSASNNASLRPREDLPKDHLYDSSENHIEQVISHRTKRSATDDRLDNEDRLWQASSLRPRPHKHRSRDECSLRKACTAGRLLARLPSVHDIMLQLRSYENEPHWEAFLWGMRKKRCSKVFCKRQRSPKGSRHSWGAEKQRANSKVHFATELPPGDDMDNIMM